MIGGMNRELESGWRLGIAPTKGGAKPEEGCDVYRTAAGMRGRLNSKFKMQRAK